MLLIDETCAGGAVDLLHIGLSFPPCSQQLTSHFSSSTILLQSHPDILTRMLRKILQEKQSSINEFGLIINADNKRRNHFLNQIITTMSKAILKSKTNSIVNNNADDDNNPLTIFQSQFIINDNIETIKTLFNTIQYKNNAAVGGGGVGSNNLRHFLIYAPGNEIEILRQVSA